VYANNLYANQVNIHCKVLHLTHERSQLYYSSSICWFVDVIDNTLWSQIPQELIQNADDAGARVVKFLVDERENSEWRTSLLTSALADLQGPALWLYNDACFTDSDLTNLCKLRGATKKEDSSKVS
jgi:hypothetical protein